MRASKHDTALRERRISVPQGIETLEPFEGAQGLMSGIPTILSPEAADRRLPTPPAPPSGDLEGVLKKMGR